MSTPKAINVDGLQRAAEQYDPIIRVMAFNALLEKLTELGIGLSEATETVTKRTIRQRKGGLSRPYVAGDDFEAGEIGKLVDRELTIYDSVLPIVDSIKNYKDKLIVVGGADNKTKKHPAELIIIKNIIETAGEDILDGIFHAKRDEADKTPYGMFDGVGEIIAKEIANGIISTAKNNYFETGAFELEPADSTEAKANMAKIIGFLRKSNGFLQKKGTLKISQPIFYSLIDSLTILTTYKDPSIEDLVTYLKNKAGIPTLSMIMDPLMGTGHNILYTVPFNVEMKMRSKTDTQFVDVRNPFTDPNLVQFWSQWEAGMQIWNLHEKEFMTNDQSWVATQLSGDYRS